MNKFKALLFAIIFSSTGQFASAQLVDFYYFEYSSMSAKVLKEKNISACEIYVKDVQSGDTTAYLETYLSYDKDGYRIAEIEYFENTPDIKIVHTYNENRQIVQTDWVWLDPFEHIKTVYDYDPSGRLIEIKDFSRHDTTESYLLSEFSKISYNKKGQMLKVIDERDSTVLTYETIGDTIISSKPDKGGQKKFVNGLLVEAQSKVKDKTTKTIYIYDELNRLTKIIRYDFDGEEKMSRLFIYSDGLLVEEQTLNRSGFIMTKTAYRYKTADSN